MERKARDNRRKSVRDERIDKAISKTVAGFAEKSWKSCTVRQSELSEDEIIMPPWTMRRRLAQSDLGNYVAEKKQFLRFKKKLTICEGKGIFGSDEQECTRLIWSNEFGLYISGSNRALKEWQVFLNDFTQMGYRIPLIRRKKIYGLGLFFIQGVLIHLHNSKGL